MIDRNRRTNAAFEVSSSKNSYCLIAAVCLALPLWLFNNKTGQAYAESSSIADTERPARQEQAGDDRLLSYLPSPLNDSNFIDFEPDSAIIFELGRNLFFDPILSGNRNISCGTCHDPSMGTGDAQSLSIGEGGRGAGQLRFAKEPVVGRVPRNAQSLYNLGAREYSHLFHDGRLNSETTHIHGAGFTRPDSERLPEGLGSVLAMQAHFPVTSAVEMAGQPGENSVADAVANYQLAGPEGAWELLAQRLRALPEYERLFRRAFSDIKQPNDIGFEHVAHALAIFQARAFRSTSSPFDALLESRNLSDWTSQQRKGLQLFYEPGGCADCHSGALLTDHRFHAIAMPQIGPGKGHGNDSSYLRQHGFADRLEDEGRYRATLNTSDLFRFRTPSLRNVALTGPWGHAGAYDTLADVIRHHLDPVESLNEYASTYAERMLPGLDQLLDSTGRGVARVYHRLSEERYDDFNSRRSFVQQSSVLRGRIAQANELSPRELRNSDVDALISFLHTLTDPQSIDQAALVPSSVPSGLPPQPETSQH